MVLEWLGLGALGLGSYLVGSLPFGYLAGRLLKGIDIREHGSGSMGATNVLRTLGKGPGLVVLLMDIGKGVAVITLTRWICGGEIWPFPLELPGIVSENGLPWLLLLSGLAAIVGHSKSIWLGFAGGKSVAISLGILLAISWPVALATLGIFGTVLAVSRIVSLSSMIGALSLPVLMTVMAQPLPYLLFAIAGGLYVIWRHQANIQRLLAGTEPQLGKSERG